MSPRLEGVCRWCQTPVSKITCKCLEAYEQGTKQGFFFGKEQGYREGWYAHSVDPLGVTTRMMYYVQDKRQTVGNCVSWWARERRGYTTQIDEAGLYTIEEVRGMRYTDIGWPQDVVDRLIVKHVRLDILRQVDEPGTIVGGK